MDFGLIRWIITIVLISREVFSASKNCAKGQMCRVTRVHGQKAADCFHKDLTEIPQCMPSDAEIIELTYNRIRKISRKDLSNYEYVRHLYLAENSIVSIDEDALSNLKYLETLDLSVNSLREVPSSIFQLPYLKTLYLSQNWDINLQETVDKAKPITSPITKLDISGITDEEITEFPEFGELPRLVFLNVSGNRFTTFNPKHIASLCNLQIFDVTNVTVNNYDDLCDCWRTNNWLQDRNVKFKELQCEIDRKHCKNLTLSEEDQATYKACVEHLWQIEKAILWSKIGIGLGACVGIILLLTIIVIIYLRRKRCKSRRNKHTPAVRMTATGNLNNFEPNKHLLANY